MEAKNISLQFKRDGITECGRLVKNVSEKKFTLSKEGSAVYVEPTEIFFDGQNGDLVLKAPVDKYISKEIASNPDFFPAESDFNQVPSLNGMMDDQEREQYGKTVAEMDTIEKLEKFPHLLQELLATASQL